MRSALPDRVQDRSRRKGLSGAFEASLVRLSSRQIAVADASQLVSRKPEINLSYTPREARHFYWHCSTAATLLDSLELNTATRVHLNNAVRMATLNAAGKSGIRLASASASALLTVASGKQGPKGLIREHVVPVSVIVRQVEEAWSSRVQYAWRELVPGLKDEDLENWKVVDSDYFLDSVAPFSAVIATLVRDRTLLAWVTSEDNARLRESGLGKSMPDYLPDNPRARYQACKIELVDLPLKAAT